MFGPLKKREDGTYVFATPVGNGHVPMIALSDLGFFARYTFDNRAATSAKELEVVSEMVGWEHLRATFEKVTGQKAEVIYQSIDAWMENLHGVDYPVANERPKGDGSTTWRQNFTAWWSLYRDDIIKRDIEWIRRVNPNGHTLESWMKENKRYILLEEHGSGKTTLLKNSEDKQRVRPNRDVISRL